MISNKQTPKEYFIFLTVIYAALLVGQIILGLVAYVLNLNKIFVSNNDLNDIFQIIGPILIICGFTASNILNKFQLKAIKQKSDLNQKLADYRASFIIKLALLEFPSLFSILCFLLTGNYLFLAFAGLVVFAFFLNRPTRFSISNEMNLTEKERLFLDQSDSLITTKRSNFEE